VASPSFLSEPGAAAQGGPVLRPGLLLLFAGALNLAGAALLPADPQVRLLLAAVGMTLACLAGLRALTARRDRQSRLEDHDRIAAFAGLDGSPCFTTTEAGDIGYQNAAAVARFGLGSGMALVSALSDLFANPGAVLHRLQQRALAAGQAQEDVVTRRGHVRLSVHGIGAGRYFWRLEEFVDRSAATRGAESLGIPMLTASRTGTVLFMNDAMRRLVGGRVRSLDRVFSYLPLRSGEEVEVAGADGPVRAIVAELEDASGKREIYLLPTPPDHPRAQAAFSGFEDLPVALVRLSPTGRLLQANRMGRTLLGIDAGRNGPGADTAVADFGLDLARLVEGLGRPVADWLGDAMAGRSENRPETLRASRRPGDAYVQITLRRVVEDARPGLVAVIADATELKSLEAQFVQSQKMQAIGQLAGGIAHDFNNLLTAISGHCDLLLLRHDPGDPDYADLIQVHQNANRAASLVGQLLAFSRKQRQSPEILDLRDVLGEITHLLGRLVGERIALHFDHDPDLPPIRADKRQLEQVLMNLVVNARDAMPEGGEIRVETEYVSLRQPLRRERVVVPAGAYVRVRVADTGTGIPPDVLPRIFEPFFTTKAVGEGTGLGLSTVYGIVKQSGGYIFADSVPGAGTSFLIYLPVCDRPQDAAAATVQEGRTPPATARATAPWTELVPSGPEPSGAASPPADMDAEDADGNLPAVTADGPDLPAVPAAAQVASLLLVEDEAPVRLFAARALRLRGHSVIEADSAEVALRLLEDPALRVDLIVSDVVMPGLDGPSWVRQARQRRPDVRVVFMSGYADGALDAGGDDIAGAILLPKPFSLDELVAVVDAQLN